MSRAWEKGMAIIHQIKPRYETRNEEIIAKLRDDAGAGPPIDPKARVKRLTAEVAVVMALIHGGDWQVQVDHEHGLAVVSRRPHPRPS